MSPLTFLLSPLLLLAFLQPTVQEKAKKDPPTVQEKAKKDLDFMQGEWVLASLEINGKEVPIQQLEGTVLTVKGDVYRTKVKKNKQLFGFRLKLDPSQDPKAVDMALIEDGGMEKVHKGIYRIEKETFKICRGLNPEQSRPNQFATWPDTNYFVATWKKAPK